MADVQLQAACLGCGGMLAGAASTSCRMEHQSTAVPAHTGAAEGAVEMDPSRRYIRYPVLLGRGACKRVYKAFDLQEGIEVAWNKAELSAHDMEPEQQERLFAEIRVLRTLHHRNIITCYEWWHDAPSQTINFITEYFTSGTLRQYRKKHLRHISDMAIKRWAFQILEGLLYLHAHSPPIVHRDLKCDNILVNGTSGQVKIADLGLASCQRGMSVVGTPEFMAPEMYDEVYDEKVDMYAFGMCMLELATLEYPYSECRSIPAIFMRVSKGIPPAALAKVQSESLRELITTCIAHDPQQRPGALQLLKHPFFADLAERPSGSPSYGHGGPGATSRHSTTFTPPFGSCGNLMALAHGSIGQQVHQHSRDSRQSSGDGSSSRSTSGGGGNGQQQGLSGQHRNSSTNSNHGAEQERGGTAESAAAAAAATASRCFCHKSNSSAQTAATPEAAGASCSLSCATKAPKIARFALPSEDDSEASFTPAANGASLCANSGAAAPASGVKLIGSTVGRMVGAVAAAAAGGARGTTVCVAKIGRSAPTHEEEDSDEEVLVPLEDVLMPHPDDILDAQALGLTSQLTHAGSGCTIMSGPDYQLNEGISGLLGHIASDSEGLGSGLLSRFASNVAVLHQQHLQQEQAGVLEQQKQQHAQQQAGAYEQQQQQQEQGETGEVARSRSAGGGAASSSGSKVPSRPSSRLGSVSGAAPSILQSCAASSQPSVTAGAGGGVAAGAAGSNAATARSSNSGAWSPANRPASAAAAAATGMIVGQQSAAVTAAQLLRSISSLSGNSLFADNQATGALAAAGLLQLSPGCYMPTPPLLEKLLSKAGTPRSSATAAAAGQPGAVHAAHRPYHCRCGSREVSLSAGSVGMLQPLGTTNDRIAAATAETASEADAVAAGGVGLLTTGMGAVEVSGSAEGCVTAAAAAAESNVIHEQQQQQGAVGTTPGDTIQQQQQQQDDLELLDAIARVSVSAAAAGAAKAQVGELDAVAQDACTISPVMVASKSKNQRATVDAVPAATAAVLVCSDADADAAALAEGVHVSVGVAEAAAAAVAALGGHGAPGPAAAAAAAGAAVPAAGGFGRILVRRRFVKNLQPAAGPVKRCNTL